MMTATDLVQLFPSASDMAVERRPPAPIHQRRWLLAGALEAWAGEQQPVLSAVCVRDDAGELRQVEIGSYPQGGAAEAEAALAAAVAAYDNGRGVWPTMAVAERIACMQDFAKQMQARARARSCG